ncbi:Protein KCNL-3, partial [Aphelenchoides avenae]
VSADFLRLNGSRQQFRNLLSARKKLGQLPPAYTRIDYSHDSTDSGLISRPHHHGPVITVEDTNGSQLNLNSNHFNHRLSISSVPAIDSQKSSVEKPNENGGLQPGSPNGPSSPPLSNACFKRTNSRYGQPLDESQVKMVYKIRSQRLNTRVQITDRCLVLALMGIILMVLDTEMCGREIAKDSAVSLCLRTLVVFSTLALLVEIVHYHINEVLLDLVDCGADDWRVVVTWRRFAQFITEFVLCSLCPLPGTGDIMWVVLEPSRHRDFTRTDKPIPVDVPLSLLMVGRLYLIGRFMVLHSKQFQDASTRTLAALNRIQVNFTFVMKTVLDQKPIWCLSVILFCFWIVAAWSFAQVERIGRVEDPYILYLNALWFIAITFNSNGYGDIVPKTIAGRIIAVCVGISGAIISSILIAVISRKILLSPGQRNVNNFMNDSKLTQRHKHAAARVLQKTWHIYKCLNSNNCPDHLLRQHQRKFLEAIHEFRRIKNKMRVFSESSSASMQQMNRLMTEMHTSMQKLVASQEEMRAQVEVLQRAMRNHFTHANAARCATLPEDSVVPAIEDAQTAGPGTPPTAQRSRRYPL